MGSLGSTPDGRLEARFRLHDTQKMVGLGARLRHQQRPVARRRHRIADAIYESSLAKRHLLDRIAYVVVGGPLRASDRRRRRPERPAALVSKEPIISRRGRRTAGRVAYVSFENKKPIIFVHSLATGKRQVVANFKGSNSGPAWSPDGRRLAVVLTKDGNSQIYTVGADGAASSA